MHRTANQEALVDQILNRGVYSVKQAHVMQRGNTTWDVVDKENATLRLGASNGYVTQAEAAARADYLNNILLPSIAQRTASLEQWAGVLADQLKGSDFVTREQLSALAEDLGIPANDSSFNIDALAQRLQSSHGIRVAKVAAAPGSTQFEERAIDPGPAIEQKKLQIDGGDGVEPPSATLTVELGDVDLAQNLYDQIQVNPEGVNRETTTQTDQPQAQPQTQVFNHIPSGDASMNTRPTNAQPSPVQGLQNVQTSLSKVEGSVAPLLVRFGSVKEPNGVVRSGIADLRRVANQISTQITSNQGLLDELAVSRVGRTVRQNIEAALRESSEIVQDAQECLQYVEATVIPQLTTSAAAAVSNTSGNAHQDILAAVNLITTTVAAIDEARALLTREATAIPPTGARDTGDKTIKDPVSAEQGQWQSGQSEFLKRKKQDDAAFNTPEGHIDALSIEMRPDTNLYKSAYIVSALDTPVFTLTYKQALALDKSKHTDELFTTFRSASYRDNLMAELWHKGIQAVAQHVKKAEEESKEEPEKEESEKEPKKEESKEEPKKEAPKEAPKKEEQPSPLFDGLKDFLVEQLSEGEEDTQKIQDCCCVSDCLEAVSESVSSEDEVLAMLGVYLSSVEDPGAPETSEGADGYTDPFTDSGAAPMADDPYAVATQANTARRNRRPRAQSSLTPEFKPGGHRGGAFPNTPAGNDRAYYTDAFGDSGFAGELVSASVIQKRAMHLAKLSAEAGIIDFAEIPNAARDIAQWTPQEILAETRNVKAALSGGSDEFVSGINADRNTAVRTTSTGGKPRGTQVDLPQAVRSQASAVFPQMRTASASTQNGQLDLRSLFTTTEDKLRSQNIDPASVKPTHYHGERR